jgi:hypothetical protein
LRVNLIPNFVLGCLLQAQLVPKGEGIKSGGNPHRNEIEDTEIEDTQNLTSREQ